MSDKKDVSLSASENSCGAVDGSRRHLRAILILVGLFLLSLAFGYSESRLTRMIFDSRRAFSETTARKIVKSRLIFFAIGSGCILVAVPLRRNTRIGSLGNKPIVINLTLATSCTLIPLLAAELALRPIIHTGGSIFIPDEELDWKLKPNIDALWGFSDIKINSKGLVGPEVDYARSGDVTRVLYVGDSVTFGFGLESYDQSYPYVTERILHDEHHLETETINSGVGGYSPWQEHIFLKREGIKYSPDLIVVGFVLNDVTEKFSLTRFGGRETSFQLLGEAATPLARAMQQSAVLVFLRHLLYFYRLKDDFLASPDNVNSISVESLIRNPDEEKFKRPWEITLENLGRVLSLCKENDIPVAVIIFPYTSQFEDQDKLSKPQRIIEEAVTSHGVPVLDLLPVLESQIESQGFELTDVFSDTNHPTALGHKIVAQKLVDFLQATALIERQGNVEHPVDG